MRKTHPGTVGAKSPLAQATQTSLPLEETMITLQDCIAFSGLEADAIRIIANLHHMPDIVATQFVAHHMQTPDGAAAIQRMLH